ncbi:hypothetical protein [Sulfuricurvum sp.]|uniref:hypothetical protein n=1 Tax=Sulfuricurvum sp. TaxID=2025608 RepID=UPI0026352815|nr:hypothetical protein [Sulfuricurvum sp.]MDD2267660.1 hypothetical protein [Sulfuricurvum sp.]MDD2784251.1 hypothetical protein [Sulfuricurvum sp.]
MNFFNAVKFNILSMFSTKSEMDILKHKIDDIEKPYDIAIDTLKKCNMFSKETTAYISSLIANRDFNGVNRANVIFENALDSINAFREKIGSALTHNDFDIRADYMTVKIQCDFIINTLSKATQALKDNNSYTGPETK